VRSTPTDLIGIFSRNGFNLMYLDTYDAWGGYPWIINQGMIFERSIFQ